MTISSWHFKFASRLAGHKSDTMVNKAGVVTIYISNMVQITRYPRVFVLLMAVAPEQYPATDSVSISDRAPSRHSMSMSLTVPKTNAQFKFRFNPRTISRWFEGHKLPYLSES